MDLLVKTPVARDRHAEKKTEDVEYKVFTFDHTKEGSPSRIPTREEIIKTFFDLCSEHHGNWQFIMLFYHELFYRVFGTPLYYRQRYVKYKDGKIELEDGDIYIDGFYMDIETFQKFYDKSIACILYDYTGEYMFFFKETIIRTKIVDGKYMIVNGILSNLEPHRILEIFEDAKKYDIKIDKSKFYIATASKLGGINTKQHELKKMEIDIDKCYNDDIPYERIKEILSKDGKSLILFYGEPGTGKTTLIKKLINEVERKFIFMDSSLMTSISNDDLIDFLSSHAGNVIVLEDCEKMLVSREESYNQTIGTVLNLTDGIIGESFGVKFICTFNSDLNLVDKAILRKGRLSLKYEFKKLPVEKARAIYPDATEEMALADAYNATEENDFSKEEKRSIGF